MCLLVSNTVDLLTLNSFAILQPFFSPFSNLSKILNVFAISSTTRFLIDPFEAIYQTGISAQMILNRYFEVSLLSKSVVIGKLLHLQKFV